MSAGAIIGAPGAAFDILPGFADPVTGAQRTFRAILDAMAHPGTVTELPVTPPAPVPLMPATAAMLLCLADQDTPVWCDGSAAAIEGWLGFHCGARLVVDAEAAVFALVTAAACLPALDRFALGSDEYPDRSATVIVQVEALAGGPPLTLTGPGIRESVSFAPAGLPDDFRSRLALNHSLFPRGVDLIMTDGSKIAALPRSTRLKG